MGDGPVRIAVSGAAGRMGRASVRAILREPDLQLVAAVGRQHAVGRDAGEVAGVGPVGVPIVADLDAVWAMAPDVLVVFAPGAPAVAHARAALARGVRPVVGSTGLGAGDLEALRTLAAERRTGAVVAPNFALGAVGLKALAAVILGGLDSIPGAIFGGLAIGVIETTIGGYIDAHVIYGFKDIVAFVVILVVLMIRPYGLFGTEHIERL